MIEAVGDYAGSILVMEVDTVHTPRVLDLAVTAGLIHDTGAEGARQYGRGSKG